MRVTLLPDNRPLTIEPGETLLSANLFLIVARMGAAVCVDAASQSPII